MLLNRLSVGRRAAALLRLLLLLMLRLAHDCDVQGAWDDGADARARQEQGYARAHAPRAPT